MSFQDTRNGPSRMERVKAALAGANALKKVETADHRSGERTGAGR